MIAALIPLLASTVFAQTAGGEGSLATPSGHQLSAGIASYTYREPSGDQPISIHAPKFVAEYTGTLSISRHQRWFAQAQVRGTTGATTYDGYCYPFVITPDTTSPNGYALDVGDSSPCSESGDSDWYIEGRGLIGKDFVGPRVAWSPYSGVGLRHLSNGISGAPGYRTENYLYLPFGLTARTHAGSHGPLSLNVEVDALMHGWNETRDSDIGGGDVPATPTAPAFTVDGFSDISFTQSSGWAVRAGADVPLTRYISLAPYFVHWSVDSSPVNYETATFTVHGITAAEQMGAYEPFNTTNEFGVRLGLHF